MAVLKPFRGDYYLWEYLPSLPGAIAFTIIFLVITSAQGWRMFKGKHWFCIPFLSVEFVKYLDMSFELSLGTQPTPSRYTSCNPSSFSFRQAVGGEDCSLISVRKTTRLFVIGDFITFNIQGNGGGLLANQKLANAGKIIVIVGLIAQVILFLAFVVCCVVFHRRFRVHLRQSHTPVEIRWEAYLNMLYVTSALILVRNVFRVVEFVMDKEGYLQQKEWPTFVFDSVLMFLVMMAFYIWYPGNLTSRLRDSTVELVPKRRVSAREASASE
ncbi:hypothetical protein NXS19_000251 [Fusarium pseudograminearum]|nr:hypothetical protein NXS19_000251 [Fusarium pseudograminearum]